MLYDNVICKIAQDITDKFNSLGWTVDMIVDYGSHSHGECRMDSDYDVNIYVHKKGWMYLFNEYAENLKNPNHEVTKWHKAIRSHFIDYQELAADLEKYAREIVSNTTSYPVCISNIFDTRLILYNMLYETWEIFSLIQGRPVVESKIYNEIIAFLKQTKPFHKNFFDIHCNYCEMANQNALTYLSNITGIESSEYRRMWLSSIVKYLRRSISLLSLIKDDWFISDKDMILKFVHKYFQENLPLVQDVYELKCDYNKHKEFIEVGNIDKLLKYTDIRSLHENCTTFGKQIICQIQEIVNSDNKMNADNQSWFNSNELKYRQLPIYRELIETI